MNISTVLEAQRTFERHLLKLKDEATTPEARNKVITELLNLRGKLVSEFDSVFKMVDTIESEIKALKLPVGNYGSLYSLKITAPKTKVIKEDVVYQLLIKEGLNPDQFKKLDTSAQPVKDIISNYPEAYEEKVGSTRHVFK